MPLMKLGVVMGGISSEREVSLDTGKEIIRNLDTAKYEVVPIILNTKEELVEKAKGLDMVFLALHGRFGEDGTIQGMLETLNIPYTGCGVLSSALCMDKDISKKILKAEGFNTPNWVTVNSADKIPYTAIEKLGYPVIVKPNTGGSSVATNIVKAKSSLQKNIEDALKYDKEVMIEEYVEGDEITCPILNGKLLPILAIKPKATFFDYSSKYTTGGADEFIVELNESLHEKVEKMALGAYKALKCSVYARVDMIIKNGVPYILEVNTLPGMTSNSLFPKSARAAGISFPQLLDLIIEYSLNERG